MIFNGGLFIQLKSLYMSKEMLIMKLYLSGVDFGHKVSAIKSVESTDDASNLALDFIDEYDLGASTYDYGFVTDDNKNLLYVIAYNGRVFEPKDYFGNGGHKVSLDSYVGKIAAKEFNYKG